MANPAPLRVLLAIGATLSAVAGAAYAADMPPVGAWRTTNQCFLAVFLLTDNGRAQAAYLSGEREENASWTWDGSTLMITSPAFPLDSFAAHVRGENLEADYTWHDLERDQLNRQTCVFERVEPVKL
jgi:hypothetical protein